jgi:biotin synthase-related radical SAM superfamily protein
MNLWKLSAGTASVLGNRPAKSDAQPTTAYLMLGEKCQNNCRFCAQARNSRARNSLLSRITWPECSAEQAAAGIAAAYDHGQLKRACVQVVTSSAGVEMALAAVSKLHQTSNVPVCVASDIATIEQAKMLLAAGCERLCIALDAATPAIHHLTKGGSWEQKWQLLVNCAEQFPGRITTHLIVGLGETEQEIMAIINACLIRNITVGLFAFTPIKGTDWAERSAPDLGCYRRIQIAHYFLQQGYSLDKINFDKGHIVAFDCNNLAQLLAGGKAFETSGCPDCNRPYYNEHPGGTMFNYPRPLSRQECQLAIAVSGVIREVQDEVASH